MSKNSSGDIGSLIHTLRVKNNMSQKQVADRLCIDISLLSKIEHGERQVQSHMRKELSEIFDLDYKSLQIKFLSKKLFNEYNKEPFFKDAIIDCMERL
ncbi:MAG: helix-turn-helix domain-containing protein [Crocinitomicaceae bacterium]|nr:helix-turn-helix domain-containing protein [Crocinitomicaceae bacterium]